jgi:hypothetical protein
MSDVELKELLAQYKGSSAQMSEKAKAIAENNIWNVWQNTAGMPKYKDRRHWAAATFGGAPAEYEIRSQLLQAGPWVEPLWAMIDDGISRSSVRNLFRQARTSAIKKKLPPAEALSLAIDEYNKTGHQAHTPDGRVYRRMSPLEKQRSQPPPSMSDVPTEMDMDSSQNRRSKQFLSRLTALADEFLRTSVPGLSGIDEMGAKIAKEEFVSFVREAAEDLRRRVYVLRSQMKRDRTAASRVSREELRYASEILGIPIVWGRDLDLRKAKKIMLQRCAQLHPDKGATTEQQKAEYSAVVEAYKTCERYMEGRKSHEDGDRSHEGQ